MSVSVVNSYRDIIILSRSFTLHKQNVIDLTSQTKAGRTQLVERLFRQHAQAVRLFLRGRLVPPDEIEDVVQELFARLAGVPRLEEKMSDSTGSSRSYLLTMANNLLLNRLRKRQRRKAYAATQQEINRESIDERTPERIVAAQLELEAMKAVIMAMPLNWRVAFILQRFRNMSYEAIALHMGVQVKQVDNYMVRAMRRIRKAQRELKAAGEQPC